MTSRLESAPHLERGLDARDVREGGRWSWHQRAKNAALRHLVRSALFAGDLVPPSILLAAGRGLGNAAWAVLRHERRVSRDNLRRAGQVVSPREVFAAAGHNLVRCLLLRRPGFEASAVVSWRDQDRGHFEDALAMGKGLVFVSAHVGPFELLPAFVAEQGFNPSIVVRESYDPLLDEVVDAHRVGRGIQVIHRGRAGAPSRIVRALRRQKPVGFLPDLGGRVASVACPFFGHETPMPIGPAKIALRMGAPVVLGTLVRHDDRFRLRIEPLPASGDVEALTMRISREIQQAIQLSARDWLWMARRLGSDTPTSRG